MDINALNDLVGKVASGRANYQEQLALLHWVESRVTVRQSQLSTKDQMVEVVNLANRHGLYNAADAIAHQIGILG